MKRVIEHDKDNETRPEEDINEADSINIMTFPHIMKHSHFNKFTNADNAVECL